MINIVTAKPLPDHQLDVAFDDGVQQVVDMSPFIRNGVSSALNDQSFFEKVMVQDGFITWPNGFDFCPESLYQYVVKKGIVV